MSRVHRVNIFLPRHMASDVLMTNPSRCQATNPGVPVNPVAGFIKILEVIGNPATSPPKQSHYGCRACGHAFSCLGNSRHHLRASCPLSSQRDAGTALAARVNPSARAM
jgi:hypothetical protein